MGKFTITALSEITADERIFCGGVTDLLRGFTFGKTEFVLSRGEKNTFVLGNATVPDLPSGKEYAISASERGLSVRGKDYGGLVRGVLALFNRVEFCGDELFIAEYSATDAFTVGNRMIHLCVFPETTLHFLRKTIRLCAATGYTHVVLEFWGTLKYDCESALAWASRSYSKDEVKALITEIRELGMSPIPMFNHLGHATGSRLLSGKHVVLNQKPWLYSLFTPDGWAWNIDNEEAWAILRRVRAELYELFGECEYFHLGLDEAYFYAHTPEFRAKLPSFLKRLTGEVAAEGVRPMLWMDMFLPDESGTTECCKCSVAESDQALASLAPSSVLVDWQYGLKTAPISSSVYLTDKGFDIVGAPWFDYENCKAHVATCTEYGLHGVMLTTWHTLSFHEPSIVRFARLCGASRAPWADNSGDNEETATLLRKVSFTLEPNDEYLDSGWCGKQIDVDVR